jgi:hypothetical protein
MVDRVRQSSIASHWRLPPVGCTYLVALFTAGNPPLALAQPAVGTASASADPRAATVGFCVGDSLP